MLRILAAAAPVVLATVLYGQTPVPTASHATARFTFEYSGLATSGPARAGATLSDEGRRAALRGSETGALDVYAGGVRIAHDLRLAFQTAHASDVIEAGTLAKTVIARPEGLTIVYSHASFTVREHMFVPLNDPGAVVILDVATLQPLTIQLRGAESDAWQVDSASAASQFYVIALAADDSVRQRLASDARALWQEKAAHFRKVRLDGASLDAPDARIGQALEWAKVVLDRRFDRLNVLAAIALGANEAARVQLISGNLSSPAPDAEWVRACYEYWLASADYPFVHAYWSVLARAIRAQPDTLSPARMAALEGVQALASTVRDRATATYAAQRLAQAQQQLALVPDSMISLLSNAMALGQPDAEQAERLLSRIGSSEYTADWGTRLLSRSDARYDPLRWDRGAVSTYQTSVIALADYRYHRPWAGFDLVRDVARETFDFTRGLMPPLLSGAYYQVLSAAGPAGMPEAVSYVSAIMRGLIGWEVDEPHHAAALEPHVPPEWSDVSVSNLRIGRDRLDVKLGRTAGVYSISLHRLTEGLPIALRIAPALPLGARVDRVLVNDAEVPVQSEESAHDLHAVIELSLTGDADVEVHYDGGLEIGTPPERTEAGEASHELKVLEFRRDQRDYTITVEGVAGASYVLPLRSGWRVRAVEGSDRFDQSGDRVSVRFTMPDGTGFVTKTLRIRVSGS